MAGNEVLIRVMMPAELARLGEIDRSEIIPQIYVQQGEQLTAKDDGFNVPPWSTEDDGEHSVAYHIAFCQRHLAAGGTALGLSLIHI